MRRLKNMGNDENDRAGSNQVQRLSDISLPKIRKNVHKVLTKYYNDPFYRTIDLIKKILRKLKVPDSTDWERTRIRHHITTWKVNNTVRKYLISI